MLLCGEVHQLVGPGSKPWYKELVENNSAEPAVAGTYMDTPEILDRQLMRQARLVKLTRLVRKDKEPDFEAAQRRLRRTDVEDPVSADFIQKLRQLDKQDVLKDPSWRFALIGVRTQWEATALNMAQLVEFAKCFDRPIIRWKLYPLESKNTVPKSLLDRMHVE